MELFKIVKKRSAKAGLPPGTLIHIGEKKTEQPRITLIDYDERHFEEREIKTINECFPFKDKPTTTWINIDGIHQVELIETLGTHFEVHPLVLEDILNTEQRPKVEDFGTYIFVVLKMFYCEGKEEDCEIVAEQISLILGSNFVLSFQEAKRDVFNSVRDRLRSGKGRVRKLGPDYLAYALIDSIVDNYFVILEVLGERIELLEEELINEPSAGTLQDIHDLKRGLLFLRRSIWPLREVISALHRGEFPLIQATTLVYLRDVYDHVIQVIDTVETYRDMIAGMLDIYLSSVSNRMNEVMKVLTIIATIFIPLTFIVGVYGMNFAYMPELQTKWGYPMVWLVMIGIALFMVFYFRKKKWL